MSTDETSTLRVLLGSSVAAGIFLHQIAKNVDIDRRPLSILGSVITTHFLAAYGLQHFSEVYGSFWSSNLVAALVVTTTLTTLWTSILLYRAFFHPLKNFPGPFGAKLSKFWSLSQVVKSKVRYYTVVNELHHQYGDYVRTGPRELMVFNTGALNPVLGTRRVKGPFYGALEKSLHTNQDDAFHKKRRKVWDMAFKKTLQDYGPSIEEFTESLLERFESTAGKPVVINELTLHYSYDVMSSLAFGASTNFIQGKASETASTILSNIKEGIVAIGLLSHIPWMLNVAETLSFIGPMKMFKSWSKQMVTERREMSNPKPDIMGYLLAHTQDDAEGRAILNAESRLIISAGSDTTATTLTVLFIMLAHFQDLQKSVREEVARTFKDGSYTCAEPQSILDAFVNEGLRIQPPVLFASQRISPKGGLQLSDGVIIPEGTVILPGTYQIHNDERYFPRPDEFIPERWTTKPELIADKSAFIPFSMGPYKCPGKSVAMMELRSVIAKTISKFDVSFPETTEFTLKEFFGNVKDHFTAGLPKTKLVFTRRIE
ncbi:putative benzoate 4-monooxygenase cytochrome P450 [Amylocarpus encephaloides]|uniref:Benzoate 4-monooxygenase cytochrome P450 n=1 Tax=Amylocarpus encephaloides TaxID=45428 RepID=A0A9P7YLA9_9HELO|nr:putative benzoate 4-monooxygenase cytochrome P450 [Amylocarpus encephaloides]